MLGVLVTPIFFMRPHRAPSGLIYAKAVGALIADRINADGMEVYKLQADGKWSEDTPAAVAFEAKITGENALVARLRLYDETLRDSWNPVDMGFTVCLELAGPPSSKGLVSKGLIAKTGPILCWVHDRERSDSSDSAADPAS